MIARQPQFLIDPQPQHDRFPIRFQLAADAVVGLPGLCGEARSLIIRHKRRAGKNNRFKNVVTGANRHLQVEWEALQAARARLQTPSYQATYAARAGVEGTISQSVRRSDWRQARYVGQAKTPLQSLLTATAFNLVRVLNWLLGVPTARTRRSRLRQLLAPLPVTA